MLAHAKITTAIMLALSVPTVVAAQESMTPTPTQRAYNDRGVQHMFDGEFDQAAANFKSSLSLGESNIAWLNYGRAMFKLRRCQEAQAAFGKVPMAPAVSAPSPSEIAGVLDRFAEEWSAACTALLTLECPDDETVVRLDDGDPFACHTNPIPVMPGLHEVAVDGWDEAFAVRVEAEPALLSLQRSLTPPPEEKPGTMEMEDSSEIRMAQTGTSSPRRIIGLTVAVAGVAALGTSLALEAAWVSPAFANYEAATTPDEWETTRAIAANRQRANRVIFFTGLGASAIGATLFFLPQTDKRSASLRVGLSGPTSVSAELRW